MRPVNREMSRNSPEKWRANSCTCGQKLYFPPHDSDTSFTLEQQTPTSSYVLPPRQPPLPSGANPNPMDEADGLFSSPSKTIFVGVFGYLCFIILYLISTTGASDHYARPQFQINWTVTGYPNLNIPHEWEIDLNVTNPSMNEWYSFEYLHVFVFGENNSFLVGETIPPFNLSAKENKLLHVRAYQVAQRFDQPKEVRLEYKITSNATFSSEYKSNGVCDEFEAVSPAAASGNTGDKGKAMISSGSTKLCII